MFGLIILTFLIIARVLMLVDGFWSLVTGYWSLVSGFLSLVSCHSHLVTENFRMSASCQYPETSDQPPVPLDNRDGVDHIGTAHGFSS